MHRFVLLTAVAVTAATLTAAATTHAAVRTDRSSSYERIARQVTSLRRGIRWHRSRTWHYEDLAGSARTHTDYAERRTRSLAYLHWIDRLWVGRHSAARRALASASRASYGSTGWDRVAQCESGGDWSLVTGNGFYWGLQWVPSTWDSRASALGLPSWSWFVSRRSAPSRAMQIRAATGMSLSNWPVCGADY